MAALPTVSPLRPRVRRLLLAAVAAAAAGTGIGYLVAVWPAPEPIREAFLHDNAVYALQVDSTSPLLRDDPRCVLFLDDWMRRPSWTLTLDHRHASGTERDVFTLHATGQVEWARDEGAPRVFHVSPVMLKRLHDLSGVSCRIVRDYRCGNSPTIKVSWGPTTDAAGNWLRETSPAYDAFDDFLDDLVVAGRMSD